MAVTLEQFRLHELAPEDRVELIALLWDSLEPIPITIPEWHVELLEQRLAEADQNPGAVVSWEEVKARLAQTP